jgi:hypothetical protein
MLTEAKSTSWGRGQPLPTRDGRLGINRALPKERYHLRNASQLPVRVVQVAWRIESSWSVEDKAQSHYPDGVGVWTTVDGSRPDRSFHNGVQVPPQGTVDLPFEINVEHLAPEGASQLATDKGLAVHVEWMLLVDNAGRRWEVRPEKGGRAKRVRPWWKPQEYMPRDW